MLNIEWPGCCDQQQQPQGHIHMLGRAVSERAHWLCMLAGGAALVSAARRGVTAGTGGLGVTAGGGTRQQPAARQYCSAQSTDIFRAHAQHQRHVTLLGQVPPCSTQSSPRPQTTIHLCSALFAGTAATGMTGAGAGLATAAGQDKQGQTVTAGGGWHSHLESPTRPDTQRQHQQHPVIGVT